VARRRWIQRPGKGGSLQVVVGPMADSIADEIRLAMPALRRALVSSPPAVIDAPKPAALANSEAQQWLNALGGDGQRLETLLPTRQPQKTWENAAFLTHRSTQKMERGASRAEFPRGSVGTIKLTRFRLLVPDSQSSSERRPEQARSHRGIGVRLSLVTTQQAER
jgi:hypothetical protein